MTEPSLPLTDDSVLKRCACVCVSETRSYRRVFVAMHRWLVHEIFAWYRFGCSLVASLSLENVDDVIIKTHQRIQEAPLPAKGILLSQFVALIAQHVSSDAGLMYVPAWQDAAPYHRCILGLPDCGSAVLCTCMC